MHETRKGDVRGDRLAIELLLCCARRRLDPGSAARIRAIVSQAIDWDHLLRAAPDHGMMPLLYWHLNATCPEDVPASVLDDLRARFRDNAGRNLFLTVELCRVIRLLEEGGISAIPYKGPVLACAVYGDLALRQFNDLDVLVPRPEAQRAKALLSSHGYRPSLELSPAQEAAYLRSNHEFPLVHETGALVEIQWAFAPAHFPFALDTEPLWDRAERIPLAGSSVPTLAPEDLLLILCAHHARNSWRRLEWICGVAELVRLRADMDWERTIAQAARLGGARMLFLGLFLAADLLGAPLPTPVRQRVEADPAVRPLARQVRRRLFRDADDRPGIFQTSLPEILFYVRVQERLADRVRYLLRLALSPTVGDRTFVSLPGPLSSLYYPLRPLRLVAKWLSGRANLTRFTNRPPTKPSDTPR